MSINDEQLLATRSQPAYRAGVRALRVMVAILAVYLVLLAVDADGRTWILLAYPAAMTTGFVLLDRAGVRIFGFSAGVWKRRGMVYRDVFGLGSRSAGIGGHLSGPGGSQ